MNPLQITDGVPPFDQMRAAHIEPAVRDAIEVANGQIQEILSRSPRTYRNTLKALDEGIERLKRVFGAAAHLNGVIQNDEIREAYDRASPLYADFHARLWTNPDLLAVAEEVLESDGSMSDVERRHTERTIQSLRQSGAHLDEGDRKRLTEARVELTDLATRFRNNVLDSTNAFRLHLEKREELEGLTETTIRNARQAAIEAGLPGWLITLHQPSSIPFLRQSRRRDLRRIVERARVTVASEDPHDNRPLIPQILRLRQEIAAILGFSNWAELQADDSMATSVENIQSFIDATTSGAMPYLESERKRIRELAIANGIGVDDVQSWDLSFLRETARIEDCQLSDDDLRPYFEINRVMEGMFGIAQKLFGISIKPVDLPTWHPAVTSFEIERDGHVISYLFADWFPRPSKRSGAWMMDLHAGGPREDGDFEPHVVAILGNFSPPDENGVSLLTHEEVRTVFHEFGHALHQILSTVPVHGLSGTNVLTGWLEVPSHLMENWIWEREALDLFASHYETGESIPDELLERLFLTRTHFGGLAQMRQLGFASTDLGLHQTEIGHFDEALALTHRIRTPYQFGPDFADDSFITAFGHIFAGGYSARYYSYGWSEAHEADLFSRVREIGLLSRAAGQKLDEMILSRGDSAEPIELFRDFMGRDLDPTAMLERNLGPLPSAADAAR